MNRSERDDLRRAALRFQELTLPHKLIALIERLDELEDQEARRLQTLNKEQFLTQTSITMKGGIA